MLAALPLLRELDLSEPPPGHGTSGPGEATQPAGLGEPLVPGLPPGPIAANALAAPTAVAAVVATREPLRPQAVAALARLQGLTHLDLSRCAQRGLNSFRPGGAARAHPLPSCVPVCKPGAAWR